MIEIECEGGVGLLRMRAGENRIGGAFLDAFEGALDEVERAGCAALVTTGEGRFYSNGLDLSGLEAGGLEAGGLEAGGLAAGGPDDAAGVMRRLHALFARVLGFPGETVAALNGHAFAAGAMLAWCHDLRVMRTGRGYLCLPEIDLATGQPLTPGMFALLGSRLERPVFHEALVTGRRYPAEEAVARAMVDEVRPEAEVLPRARELAGRFAGVDGATAAALKRGLYAPALAALESAAA